MSDDFNTVTAAFAQKQRSLAANLVHQGVCSPDEAMTRAKTLAVAEFKKKWGHTQRVLAAGGMKLITDQRGG